MWSVPGGPTAINTWNLDTSMEHHQDFNVYSKQTGAEIIVNMIFFKHKYLTSPILTPVDTVVEATKIITDSVTTNSNSTKSE